MPEETTPSAPESQPVQGLREIVESVPAEPSAGPPSPKPAGPSLEELQTQLREKDEAISALERKQKAFYEQNKEYRVLDRRLGQLETTLPQLTSYLQSLEEPADPDSDLPDPEEHPDEYQRARFDRLEAALNQDRQLRMQMLQAQQQATQIGQITEDVRKSTETFAAAHPEFAAAREQYIARVRQLAAGLGTDPDETQATVEDAIVRRARAMGREPAEYLFNDLIPAMGITSGNGHKPTPAPAVVQQKRVQQQTTVMPRSEGGGNQTLREYLASLPEARYIKVMGELEKKYGQREAQRMVMEGALM